MLDDDAMSTVTPETSTTAASAPAAPRTRRRAASRPAGPPAAAETASPEVASVMTPAPSPGDAATTIDDKPAKKATRKRPSKKTAATITSDDGAGSDAGPAAAADSSHTEPAVQPKPARRRTSKKAAANPSAATDGFPEVAGNLTADVQSPQSDHDSRSDDNASGRASETAPSVLATVLFQPPDPAKATPRKRASRAAGPAANRQDSGAGTDKTSVSDPGDPSADDDDESGAGTRRRRSRGGRNRRKSSGDDASTEQSLPSEQAGDSPEPSDSRGKQDSAGADDERDGDAGTSRRRRRRRRGSEDAGDNNADSGDTAVRVRQPRAKKDKDTVTSVEGSTRVEAKKQRRREGREAGRRRPPILSESEFLARRESVERVMAIRQRGDMTQIAVLEDDVLVEHYVARESQSSIIGNVYVGRVQNVLPSMEAAFIDIGKGRNAVLYAGEVNWDLRDDVKQPRRIENALKPGQAVLVQVSKDPIGHKGARLTSQISLPGRYLVFVPAGGTSGISRKLPDTERNRLKNVLKDILSDDAGVIIRTAAEGASEEELTRDVTRLTARWEDIEKKSKKGQAPQLLYAEPDTTLRVVRDLFTEDFSKLVIHGDDAWDMVDGYVQHVAPDLIERLERYDGSGDIFDDFRIDEQIAKAMERKVWLPSGGSLVIDRTEAMTVVDVNTGKFTGSGGNLEETVTKNNLEAAEEVVRQLRLRDIGGIIVVDFIDMVLEDNRDLVLRRLVECLGRDRTRHQVAEVTSLGLVQMTRKRISTGLLEAFGETCEHCQGRGVVVHSEPVEPKQSDHGRGGGKSESGQGGSKRSGQRRGGRKSGSNGNGHDSASASEDKDAGGGSSEDKTDRDADSVPENVGAEPAPAS
ncbi:MAG: Rne/Rng family ribonuclease [Nocardioidaceae bacterium]|nr:Rne/Rng family ribonuclease [Nocardioidaceae bacterium]